MTAQDPSRERVFYALWPPPELQGILADWARELQRHTGGKPLTAERIHVTLAFIGSVLPAQTQALLECGDGIAPPRAQLVLDQLGFWARKGILWAGSREPDPHLLRFVDQLHQRLRRLGFRLEDRPFRPHITLLRRARRRARTDIEPLVWPVNEFVLVRSQLTPEGAQYMILRRWSAATDME